VKNDSRMGFVVLLIVIIFAVFSFVVLFRSSATGNFVDATVPKKYIFNEPEIRDSRLLYCPPGLVPYQMNANLEAHMSAGRKCIPSPYVDEFPHLKEYYCCGDVFAQRYIDELPSHPELS